MSQHSIRARHPHSHLRNFLPRLVDVRVVHAGRNPGDTGREARRTGLEVAVSGTKLVAIDITHASFIFNAIMTVIVAAAGFFLVSHVLKGYRVSLIPDPRLARPVSGVLDE